MTPLSKYTIQVVLQYLFIRTNEENREKVIFL